MSSIRVGLAAVLLLGLGAVAWYRSLVYRQADPGARPKLVMVTGGDGPYWQLLSRGAKAAATELDAELETVRPSKAEDVAEQTKLLAGLPVKELSGVAISPLDAESQTTLINRLAEQLFIVSVDSDAPLSNRRTYIGASNYAAGLKAAQLLQEAAPSGGKVVVLLANLTKHNTKERKIGFEERLASSSLEGETSPELEVLDFLVDEGDLARCEQQVRKVMADQPDLAAIVGMNGYHGPLLLKALKAADKLGKIKLIAFDTLDATLDGVEAGHIHATIAQDPYQYGYEAVRKLVDLCGRSEDSLPLIGVQSSVNIKTRTLRKEDIAEFRLAKQKQLTQASVGKE